MPKKYDQQAIDQACTLYIKYGGKNLHKVVEEMRRIFPGFSMGNLIGKGKEKPGWIELYAWEKKLELKLQADQLIGLNTAQKLAREIQFMREQLYAKASADPTDKDLVNAHAKYSELSIKALERIEAARHSYEGFIELWESLLDWLPDYSIPATQELIKHSPAILERAKKIYGAAEPGTDS